MQPNTAHPVSPMRKSIIPAMAAIFMPDSQTAALPPDAVNAVNVLRRFLLRQWVLLLSMPLLLWPALYNGFPLVFSDSGTYISQLIERHLGWDRPPFYSLFLLLLGWASHSGRL